MNPGRKGVRIATFALAAVTPAALAGLILGTPVSAAASSPPSIRLIAATSSAEIHLGKRGSYEIHFPVLVASVNGPFELWAQRATYDDPVSLSQIVRDPSGAISEQLTVAGVPEPDLGKGLPAFLQTSLTKRNGTPIKDASRAFCSNSYLQERLDDTGPDVTNYPAGCWASPFSRGSVWGIEQGWGTDVRTSLGRKLRVDEGTYRLTVSIAEPYRTAFGISDNDASVTVPVTVMNGGGTVTAKAGSAAEANAAPTPEATSMPITVPPDSALPDIEALPAWGMTVDNRVKSGRSFLNFGATAWNAGPGILAVEGFRQPDSTTMNAFQYFYENGDVVGKVDAGTLEYDSRPMHDHWHFRDFAAYSLLDDNHVKVLDSGKEAFCLAPTDPIDLTVDNAEWRPWLTDLSTACGEEGSVWIREVLQTGWGDTYAQYRPGQSFEITDLPNGTYFVKVQANPDGVLLEASSDNNVALREIHLRGRAGERRVVVPAYGLIDSEGSTCGKFC
ncbi:MAG: lysyl oxidase family protein [Actinomycetes bacterium]